jgi:hypothetical protein
MGLLEQGKRSEGPGTFDRRPEANKEERSLLRQERGSCRSQNPTCCLLLAHWTVLSPAASSQSDSISSARNIRGNFWPARLSAPAYRTVDREWHVIAARRIKQAPQQLLRSTGRASRKHSIHGTFHWQVSSRHDGRQYPIHGRKLRSKTKDKSYRIYSY